MVIVKSRLPHSRGQEIAGASGNLYRVDPETMLLHRVVGGQVAEEPGCEQVDADRLLQFDAFSPYRSPAPVAAPAPSPEPEVEENPTSMDGGEEVEDSQQEPADLSVLDGSVRSLIKALSSGDYDHQLDQILAAEQAGKTRKSAVAAIEERLDSL